MKHRGYAKGQVVAGPNNPAGPGLGRPGVHLRARRKQLPQLGYLLGEAIPNYVMTKDITQVGLVRRILVLVKVYETQDPVQHLLKQAPPRPSKLRTSEVCFLEELSQEAPETEGTKHRESWV